MLLEAHVLILVLTLFSDEDSGNRVKYLYSFFDERWAKSRATRSVTDVNWSHKVREYYY